MRAIRQILLSIKSSTEPIKLTCEECFSFLEHLAEEAIAGADERTLNIAIREHVTSCPECHEHHLERLSKLEKEYKLRTATTESEQ